VYNRSQYKGVSNSSTSANASNKQSLKARDNYKWSIQHRETTIPDTRQPFQGHQEPFRQ
jgi:hypothetical protein